MSERILVIGAGMAGLTAASTLAGRGFSVTVFDKGRGAGGRMATRRIESGAEFDHGAQYVTARGLGFRQAVEGWIRSGAVQPWKPTLAQFRYGRAAPLDDEEPWFAGAPRMSSWLGALAAPLDVRWNTRVATLAREDGQWSAVDEWGNDLGRYDIAIVAVPAPQALPFLGHAPALARALGLVRMAPCWAAMVAFEEPLGVAFGAAKLEGAGLAWVAQNSAKPGRDPAVETWVLHASPDWSRAYYDADQTEAAQRLLAEFRSLLGLTHPVQSLRAHRWRYARVDQPLGLPYLWDGTVRLGLCGDWCIGARVESAWESGDALAMAVA